MPIYTIEYNNDRGLTSHCSSNICRGQFFTLSSTLMQQVTIYCAVEDLKPLHIIIVPIVKGLNMFKLLATKRPNCHKKH